MSDYSINAVDRKVSYTGSAGLGPYAFSFEILVEDDVAVYLNETLLTKTTDYTVTINANGTGEIDLVTGGNISTTPDADDLVVILGARDIERTTDFVTAGDLRAAALNEQLDALTIYMQQIKEEVDRSVKAPAFDPTGIDMVLPKKADRVNAFIAFDANGDVSAAVPSDDVTTLAEVATDIATLADIEDGTDATDAISDTAAIASNVTTVAGISSNVTTVAGNTSNINTVAGDLSGDDDIGTVADNISDVSSVAAIDSDVTAVAADATDIGTVATDIADVSTVAGISANVTTVAGISSDVTTVAADGTDIGAVATDIANVNTLAAAIANVNTAATNIASINTCASDISQIITTANDLNEAVSEIDTVATNIADVQTVGDNIANVNTVAGIDSDVTTVAGDSADIQAVAANSANINTVAGIDSDVTAVAAIDSDVTTAAANVADITNFADVYQGAKASAPTLRNDGSALQTGDLYFDTTLDQMRVFDGSSFIAVGSSVNGTAQRYKYTATASQTSFSGTDDNGVTLAYDAGYIDVYLNGVHLDPSDYTATSGTSIVLDTGAALNDELYIVAFGNFQVADTVSKSLGGTFAGNVVFDGSATFNGSVVGIDTDKITEGNSSVEVVDTGTGHVAVTVDGSETARFDANGRLGIGTTSPSKTLDVRGTSATDLVSALFTTTANGAADDTNTILLGCAGNDLRGITIKAKKDNASNAHSLFFGTSGDSATPVDHMRLDKNGNLYFNSGYGSIATAYGCRAWVKFDGTGTPSIDASGNVSSITDNGTGLYTINFTTAMPDANYSVTGIAARPSTNEDMNINLPRNGTYTTSAVRVFTHSNANGTALDAYRIGVQIFR